MKRNRLLLLGIILFASVVFLYLNLRNDSFAGTISKRITNENDYIEIHFLSIDKDKWIINYSILNNTSESVTYGEWFDLEYFYKGSWHYLHRNDNSYYTTPAIAYELEPGDYYEFEIPINMFKLPLQSGKYRLLKSFSNGRGADSVVFYSCEFDI